MKFLRDQRGSSLVVVMLVIAVVSIAGVAAYRISNNNQLSDETSSSGFSSSEPKDLKTSADVKRAENSLDTVEMDSPDQLNQDASQL